MTQKEIYQEIERLRAIAKDMERQERAARQAKARELVGKCYRQKDGTMLKIIDVPQVKLTMYGETYNENQFIAVFLNYVDDLNQFVNMDEISPLYRDTVFCNQWSEPGPKYNDGLTEISQEEFNAELNRCVDRFKELINTVK